MYPVEKGSKLMLDASILLRHTWGCIFEVDPQPFLFAGFFEGSIFACIVAAKMMFLQIEFNFQIIN